MFALKKVYYFHQIDIASVALLKLIYLLQQVVDKSSYFEFIVAQ